MSWSIPTKIEEDIISGKAQYRTFQTGVGGQSILPVPNNAYAVIFGYDYSPAGGGFKFQSVQGSAFSSGAIPVLNNVNVRWFETQQISFYTGTDFYPFVHHCDIKTTALIQQIQAKVPGAAESNQVLSNQIYEEVDNTPISRQVYITSDKDITISVGLILDSDVATTGAIPITNRTPALLTYGGSPQTPAVQTDFGPAATPIQFMQPSPKDFQDFAFGLLPNGANGQAFATPDVARGLADPSQYLTTLGATFRDAAAANYFLCLHYALYTRTIPEQRG
jgi:hypothetical protein